MATDSFPCLTSILHVCNSEIAPFCITHEFAFPYILYATLNTSPFMHWAIILFHMLSYLRMHNIHVSYEIDTGQLVNEVQLHDQVSYVFPESLLDLLIPVPYRYVLLSDNSDQL